MSIDCFYPWFKNLANLRYGLKTKCFLAPMDFSHQHCEYTHFFTINAPLEYYFFRYKEMETFSEGKKKSYTALLKQALKERLLEPPM